MIDKSSFLYIKNIRIIIKIIPIVIKISEILKTGNLIKSKEIKSITYPYLILSYKFPIAPEITKSNDIFNNLYELIKHNLK